MGVRDPGASELLREFAQRQGLEEDPRAELILTESAHGLELLWQPPDGGKIHLNIDIDAFVARQRSYPAPKQPGLNQAIGKKTRTVLDATGGWGADALLLCSQGYQVTLLERSPLMALLLKDAMHRLSATRWAISNEVSVPVIIQADGIDALKRINLDADCIYLDPMFPPKRKKSASSNKYMQLLQRLIGPDHDASQLVAAALQAGFRRVVVKRPDYAPPLYSEPSLQFSSKLVHYDVYLH